MFMFLSLFLGALLALDPRKPIATAGYWVGTLVRTGLWATLIAMSQYLLLPSFVGPLWGSFILTILIFATARLCIFSHILKVSRNLEISDTYSRRYNSSLNFTYIEVIVVIAIIGILIAMLMPAIVAAANASGGSNSDNRCDRFGGFVLILLLAIVVGIIDFFSLKRLNYSSSDTMKKIHIAALLGIIIVGIGIWVNSWSMWRPAHFRNLLGNGSVSTRPWEDTLENPSEESLRAISEEQALWKMGQVLTGTTGTLFHAGKAYHQRLADGKSYWVAPLVENNPGSSWFQRTIVGGEVPFPNGYVVCSSENPSLPAYTVEKLGDKPIALRYNIKAAFGNNLERLLYTKNPETRYYVRRRWAFELDNEGRPFYIAALCKPTVGYSGEVVEKYAQIDPQTGDIKIFNKEDLPDWVDNPMPTELIHNYIAWWGKYPKSIGDGWWDHLWNTSGRDIVKAGSPDHRLTWDAKGEPHVFTSMTSTSNRDSSTKSYMLIDPRTGEAFESECSGQTEKAVLQAVNALVSFQNRHGTTPVLFNIYGHRTWVVPVAGENNAPMGIALVDKDVRRTPVYNEDKNTALTMWRQYLAKSSDDVVPTAAKTEWQTATGIIDQREIVTLDGNSLVYLRLREEPSIVYVISSSEKGFDQAVLSKTGEQVELKFLGFGDDTTSVQIFKNLNTTIKATPVKDEVVE